MQGKLVLGNAQGSFQIRAGARAERCCRRQGLDKRATHRTGWPKPGIDGRLVICAEGAIIWDPDVLGQSWDLVEQGVLRQVPCRLPCTGRRQVSGNCA